MSNVKRGYIIKSSSP